MKKEWIKTITSFITLSILVIGFSIFFIFNESLIGIIYLLLSGIGVLFLKFFKITIKEVSPDIVFGIVDNGVLVFTAFLGGIYAGIGGAILGGVAGNTITDGLGGIFEGRMAKKLKIKEIAEKRDALASMLGKMIGCLFGAGVGILILTGIKFLI